MNNYELTKSLFYSLLSKIQEKNMEYFAIICDDWNNNPIKSFSFSITIGEVVYENDSFGMSGYDTVLAYMESFE